MSHRRADWVLAPSAESAPEARRLVEQLLEGLSTESVEVVLLLTTELVANAVQHGSGPVGLRVGSDDGGVRVEVEDEASTLLPVVQEPDPESLSGRGLLLVDGLSDGWGVRLHDTGKTVWFDLVPPAGSPQLGGAGSLRGARV